MEERRMKKSRVLWLVAAAMVVLTIALAASPLRLVLQSYKVVQIKGEDGKLIERLIPAAEVKPGDILEWVLEAENVGDIPLTDVALTIPIPSNTIYLAGSAKPLKLAEGVVIYPLFSYDGVHFSRPPLTREIKVKEGDRWVTKKVVVPPEEYTHVRWVVPRLDPGEKVRVSLRTKVR